MIKIKDFLLKNGYDLYYCDDYRIEGGNEFLRIAISKNEDNSYLIRNAILWYFDRWANSGIEFCVKTDSEVIHYFSQKDKCLTDAISELVEDIIEDGDMNHDETNIRKMISYLYSLLRSDSE